MKQHGGPSRRIPPGAPGHPRPAEERFNGSALPARRREETRPGQNRGLAAPRHAESAAKVVFLYEDEDLVAVSKPAGLPVIAPEGSRARSLLDIVSARIRERNPKGRAAVVHRIDRDTSGLLIFAKSAKAKRAFMENWDSLVLERRYVALVEGTMADTEGRYESWLAENRGGEVYVADRETRGAKRAVTQWQLLASGNGLSLLELRLETGRKHQIRVQLAAAGHPVCGDQKYGRARDPLGRLALHATGLTLIQPFTKERLELTSPPPYGFKAAFRITTGPASEPAAGRKPRRFSAR